MHAIGALCGGISRQRVQQILRENGLDRSNGGYFSERMKHMREKKRTKNADRRYKVAFGVAREVVEIFRAMDPDYARTPLPFYRGQKRYAKVKGIEWRITLTEWWAAWEASGKWAQRGNRKGCYGLSRIDRTKGFIPGNLAVVRHEDIKRSIRSVAKSEEAFADEEMTGHSECSTNS